MYQESLQVHFVWSLFIKQAKSTLAESDAVIALDVDGEQVTVFKCAICDQLFPTLPLLEVSIVLCLVPALVVPVVKLFWTK